jgi:hypothetical protein
MRNRSRKAKSRGPALERALLTGIVAGAVPGIIWAGDCPPGRPQVLAEIEVIACAPLDAKNVETVSRAIRSRERSSSDTRAAPGQPSALRAEVVAHKRGVVIEATVKRVRNLQVNLVDRANAVASAWTPAPNNASVHFFYPRQSATPADAAAPEAVTCERLHRTPIVAVMLSGSCECDTGPGPQGYCVIDEDAYVYDVPADYARYVR